MAIRRETLIKDPSVCVSFYKEENQRKKEYLGRQLLELIQNAEDEAPQGSGKVEIWLEENKLVIANNGQPFSERGLESLMTPNVSAKLKDDQKIGVKGLGFRSLLNWSNKIEIVSNDLSLRFSRESAISFLEDIYGKHPEVKEKHQDTLTDKYPIATLAAPVWISDYEVKSEEYTTHISIFFESEEVVSDIKKQINELKGIELLFLRNITSLIINHQEVTKVIEKKEKDGQTQIVVHENEKPLLNKSWTVFIRTGQIPDELREEGSPKSYELKIALSKNLDDSSTRLYSYFRTKISFNFPALIHGTFDLSGDRNTIMDTKVNHYLIDELIQLLIDTALELAKNKVNWKPMSFLSFDDVTASGLSDFDFMEKLVEKIKENRLFPTIYDKYITYNDEPVYYRGNFPRLIDYKRFEIFEDLCQFSDDDRIYSIYTKIGGYTYDKSTVTQNFNSISPKLSIKERVKCLLYLNDHSYQFDKPPQLLLDSKGRIIDYDDEIFSQPEVSTIDLPNYVKLKFVSQQLLDEIKNQGKVRTNREAIKKISEWDITEYALTPVLRKAVQAEKVERVNSPGGQKLLPMLQLLQALIKIYSSDPEIAAPKGIELPNRNMEFVPANELYLGREYESGKFNDQLLRGLGDERFVLGLTDRIGSSDDDMTSLLVWLGVNEDINVRTNVDVAVSDEFLNEILEDRSFPLISRNYNVRYADASSMKKTWGRNLKSESVEEFEAILKNDEPEIILYWIISDSEVSSRLIHYRKSQTFYFDQYNKRYKDYISVEAPSYLGFKLAYSPWLSDSNGNKVCPKDCVMIGSSLDLENILSVPSINYTHPLFVENSITKERIDLTLKELGVKDDFKSLKTSTIYELMMNLPQLDPEGSFAGRIYEYAYEALKEREIKSSDNKQFIKSGRVLVRRNSKKSYLSIERALYLADLTISRNIREELPLIVMNRRLSKPKIEEIFGVLPVGTIEYRITSEPRYHPQQMDLSEDLEEFKLYFYTSRIRIDTTKIELNRLKRLHVHFVTNISAEFSFDNENWKPLTLNENEYFVNIDSEAIVYVKIPSNALHIRDLKDNVAFCKTISTIFTNWLDLVEKDENSFLYSMTSSGRKQWLDFEYSDGEDRLEQSRLLFDQTDIQKVKFWDSLFEAINNRPPESTSETNDFFGDKLNTEDFDRFSSSINYHNLSNLHNYDILKSLFEVFNVNIQKFNDCSPQKIDIGPILQSALERTARVLQTSFEKVLYDELYQKPLEEQLQYFEKLRSFESFQEIEIENSFSFNPEDVFVTWISSKFGLTVSNDNTSETWLADTLLSRKKDFISKNTEYHISDLSDFENLLLFENYDLVYKELYVRKESSEQTDNPEQLQEDESKDNLFDKLARNVSEGKVSIKKNTIVSKKSEKGDQFKKKQPKVRNNYKPISVSDDRKLEIGEAGEILVYHVLSKSESIKNMKWHSKYAEKHGKVRIADDSLGYDFSYIDKSDDQIKYVEVKSTTAKDIHFHLSKPELNVALRIGLNYSIFMVTGVESENPCIYPLIELFTDEFDFLDNEHFNVVPDGYYVSGFNLSELENIEIN